MDKSVNNTLLALLLAVNQLETPLTQEEEVSLTVTAQQFLANDKGWDIIIEQELMKMITANQALAKNFNSIKNKLDNLATIPPHLIPTNNELDTVLSTVDSEQPTMRPLPNIDPKDGKNNDITNMAIRVMLESKSSDKIKKLNRLEKLWEFLNQPIK